MNAWFASFVFGAAAVATASEPAAGPAFAIYTTAEVRGSLDPCG